MNFKKFLSYFSLKESYFKDSKLNSILDKMNKGVSITSREQNFLDNYDNIIDDEFKDVKEDYTVIQSRGSTYTVLLNWRGQHLSVQIFFPKSSRPTKDEVVFEIRKIYPNAMVFSYAPSIKDPTKPLLFTGQTNEPR